MNRLVEKVLGRDPVEGVEPAGPHAGSGRSLSMLTSALSLIAGKVATMGLGFLFWLLAARTFEQSQVGLAAAAVSAVMLCTQLALLGIGSSVIVQFPRHLREPSRLLDTAFTVVGISSLLTAGAFVAIAGFELHHLRVVATNPAFAAAFAAMSVVGTVAILLDQVSTVLRRGDQALARAVVFGLVNIGLLGSLVLWSGTAGAFGIFATWVGAGVAAVAVGMVQLARVPVRYRYGPRLGGSIAWPLLRVGLPNHWLTLTERAPGLILPIVVTEIVSPAANAAWYAAWMMAWVIYIIPIQVGLTLFAEAAHRPESLRRLVRHGLRQSLLLGLAGGGLVALAAPHLLAILGPGYAAAGTTPLRLLVLAVLPLTFVQAYFVFCRSRGLLREAILVGAVGAALSIGGAAAAGAATGLVGMAVAWVGTQALAGAWAFWRLWRLARASGERTPSLADRSELAPHDRAAMAAEAISGTGA